MIYQHVFLGETRLTLIAGKRFLPCVNPSCSKAKKESALISSSNIFQLMSLFVCLLPAVHLER